MRNQKRSLALITTVLITGLLTFASVAPAASVSVDVDVPKAATMTVPAALSLNVEGGATVDTSLVITGIKANCAWNISLYKEADLSNGTKTIPSEQLKFTSTGHTEATELPTSGFPATVASGAKTGETGATETVEYSLALSANDDPGQYTAIHIYTLNTP